MDPKTLLYLAMVYVWCSLHAGRMLLMVAAEIHLSAEIITLDRDLKEGRQVQIKCTATNFDFQKYVLEWQKDGITLKRNEETATSKTRLYFYTMHATNGVTTALLGITGVLRNDSGTYMCSAVCNGTSNVASTVQVTLSVLYFPSEFFPICFPAGPISAVAGTELNLQCSSEVGNPQVVMEISQSKYNETFTLSHHGDMISMSLALIAHVDYNNVQFLCTITSPMYYPNMSRTCIIGPINVSNVTEQKTTPTTKTTAGPIIAGAAAGVVVLIFLIILIIVCRRRHGLCKMKQSSEDNTSTKIPTTTASTRNTNSEPFQPNFNNDNGHGHKHDTHNRAEDEVSSPAPESSSSHSGITLPRRAEVPDSSLIYAKPQKATVVHQDNEHGITNITEQSFTNPVFDSKSTEDAKRPFGDHPKMSVKPVAKVQPNMNVPKKPAPYRPKSDRTSNTHDNPMTSPSQDHTEPSSGHPQDGRQETSSPPSDVTYAQVSVPIRQNSSSSQKPGDDITYAELDLTSHTTQDDEVAPASSAVGPIIYATVSKTK